MKLQNELDNIITKLKEIKKQIPPYAEQLKQTGGCQSFENRLAWDCLRTVIGTRGICDLYDRYNCNDTHIQTLAKKALKSVYDCERMC